MARCSEARVAKMVGWTVTPEHPEGNPLHAAEIVGLWASESSKLVTQWRDGAAVLKPNLFERPILQKGEALVQLPWAVGLQNNSTAAINILRAWLQKTAALIHAALRSGDEQRAAYPFAGNRVMPVAPPPRGWTSLTKRQCISVPSSTSTGLARA